MLHNFNYCLTL